jgi:hypothetical protein
MSADRAPQPVIDLVEWVRALPYGRPGGRTVAAMLEERRGTCSTKHLFLAQRLAHGHPQLRPTLVHRVWRVRRRDALRRFGAAAASVVPPEGLVDVHRFLLIALPGRRVAVDVTFPGVPPWDGRSAMPLACGPGVDYVARGHPDAHKRGLERRHCDAAVREPFIAALAEWARA